MLAAAPFSFQAYLVGDAVMQVADPKHALSVRPANRGIAEASLGSDAHSGNAAFGSRSACSFDAMPCGSPAHVQLLAVQVEAVEGLARCKRTGVILHAHQRCLR